MMGLRRGGVVAYVEGRDTDIVYRDGMRGMWHGMPECFRRTGRNGKEARRMQKEGIGGNMPS